MALRDIVADARLGTNEGYSAGFDYYSGSQEDSQRIAVDFGSKGIFGKIGFLAAYALGAIVGIDGVVDFYKTEHDFRVVAKDDFRIFPKDDFNHTVDESVMDYEVAGETGKDKTEEKAYESRGKGVDVKKSKGRSKGLEGEVEKGVSGGARKKREGRSEMAEAYRALVSGLPECKSREGLMAYLTEASEKIGPLRQKYRGSQDDLEEEIREVNEVIDEIETSGGREDGGQEVEDEVVYNGYMKDMPTKIIIKKYNIQTDTLKDFVFEAKDKGMPRKEIAVYVRNFREMDKKKVPAYVEKLEKKDGRMSKEEAYGWADIWAKRKKHGRWYKGYAEEEVYRKIETQENGFRENMESVAENGPANAWGYVRDSFISTYNVPYLPSKKVTIKPMEKRDTTIGEKMELMKEIKKTYEKNNKVVNRPTGNTTTKPEKQPLDISGFFAGEFTRY